MRMPKLFEAWRLQLENVHRDLSIAAKPVTALPNAQSNLQIAALGRAVTGLAAIERA